MDTLLIQTVENITKSLAIEPGARAGFSNLPGETRICVGTRTILLQMKF